MNADSENVVRSLSLEPVSLFVRVALLGPGELSSEVEEEAILNRFVHTSIDMVPH